MIASDDIFTGTSLLNTYTQNIWYGDAPDATYNSITYDLSTEFGDFRNAIGDADAQFIDPEFTGADSTVEAYYVPRNSTFLFLYDPLRQSVGAVDIMKYQ